MDILNMDLTDLPLQFVDTNGIRLAYRRFGAGPPLILLHGYPQNHLCWARVAPTLAEQFDVILPDLRGYGASDAPRSAADHSTYSKRMMAQDIIGLMDALGIAHAAILGHDRGARVTYRLALDHPTRVSRIGIIEIVPTGDFWAAWDADLALKAYHWTFLAQAEPVPERMIAADPTAYLDHTLKGWTLAQSLDVFPPEALGSYRAQMQDPARSHAMCADYRAGAYFDRPLDDADKAAGRKIDVPLAFLWAEDGFPAQAQSPAALWEGWARDVRDASCQSGHFVMEENPKAVLDLFLPFFTETS
jgi:haloacetate dehalogenase